MIAICLFRKAVQKMKILIEIDDNLYKDVKKYPNRYRSLGEAVANGSILIEKEFLKKISNAEDIIISTKCKTKQGETSLYIGGDFDLIYIKKPEEGGAE